MKLKQWLREQKQLTYNEYRALPEEEREELAYEHQRFCRREQLHENLGWRPMTEEEIRETDEILARCRKRYEESLKIGGIDYRGNYTALHHRWED